MKRATSWISTDNTSPVLKAELRKRYLKMIEKPAVLDLFCGLGVMYQKVYKELSVDYLGIDKKKIHDPSKCIKTDNRIFIQKHDLAPYNVFDLDDYGCPWAVLYLILKRIEKKKIVVFITDGLRAYHARRQKPPKIVSATNRIPRGMQIPGAGRWYLEMFKTMLLDLENRYGYQVTKGEYFFNKGRSVCYWGLIFEKKAKISEKIAA